MRNGNASGNYITITNSLYTDSFSSISTSNSLHRTKHNQSNTKWAGDKPACYEL